MKKLLSIFCGVLIASLSMTFVSCSNDDDMDEENNGISKINKLTIDNTNYDFVYFAGRVYDGPLFSDPFIQATFRTDRGKEFSFQIGGWDTIEAGRVYTAQDNRVGVWWDDAPYDPDHTIEGGLYQGSIRIDKLDRVNKILEITFNKSVFYCEWDDVSLSINGTLRVDDWGYNP